MTTVTSPFLGMVRLMGTGALQEVRAWDRYMDAADYGAPYEEEEVAKALWLIASDNVTDLVARYDAVTEFVAAQEQDRARRAAARKVTPKMAALRSNPRLLVMAR